MLDNQEIINSIAAKKLGPAPGAAAAPAGSPAAAQPGGDPAAGEAPQGKPKADPAPTNMEKAAAKVAPNDPSKQDATTDVKLFKLGEREYTEEQLNGTMQRYRDLNFKWQTNKPVISVIEQFTEMAKKAGHEVDPGEMAGLMDAAMRAYLKNPQMGGDSKKANKEGGGKPPMGDEAELPGDDDAMYEKWEKENAVSLPPGFRESTKATKAMQAKLDQMLGMFQQVIQGGLAGQNAQQQAAQTMQQASATQADATTRMIANNLSGAFTKAGLSQDPETRNEFRMFSAQRGYDFPDFMDGELAATVVADFNANRNAPEFARMREVLKKRQAFTGAVEGAPGAATGGAPAAAGDATLNGLIDSAMSKRGMV